MTDEGLAERESGVRCRAAGAGGTDASSSPPPSDIRDPEPALCAAWPVTALIYAHNDESSVEDAIQDVASALEPRTPSYEILVIDDASDDHTAARAEAVAGDIGEPHGCATAGLVRPWWPRIPEAPGRARPAGAHSRPLARQDVPRCRVLRRDGPPGLGAALRLGLAEAQHPLILQTDARQRLDLTAIDAMLAELDLCHLVVGRRRRRARGPCRPFAAAILWFLRRVVYGIPVADVDSPLWLYRREIFERMRIQSDGAFATAEILAKAGFFGFMLGEVHVAGVEIGGPHGTVGPVPPPQRQHAAPRFRREPLGHILREAWELFRRPDFQPPDTKRDRPCSETETP